MQAEDESVARGALYHCISPSDPNSHDKLIKVRQYAEAEGWKVTEYLDEPASGDDTGRPGLQRLLVDQEREPFEVLVLWSLVRVARDLERLGKTLHDLVSAIPTVDVNCEINNPSGFGTFNDNNPRLVIGYWHGDGDRGDEDPFPHPQALVDFNWEPDRRSRIVAYLRAGTKISVGGGFWHCRFRCAVRPPRGKEGMLCDHRWCWPEQLAHYVEHHGVRLPDEFVAHAVARNFEPPLAPIEEDPDDDHDFPFSEDLSFWTAWCEQHAPFQFEALCWKCAPPSHDERLGEGNRRDSYAAMRVAFHFDTAGDNVPFVDIKIGIGRVLGVVVAGAVLQAARVYDDRIERYLTTGSFSNAKPESPDELVDFARHVCQVAEDNAWTGECWHDIYWHAIMPRAGMMASRPLPAGRLGIEAGLDLPEAVTALAMPLLRVIIGKIWFGDPSNHADDAIRTILAAETGWTDTWRERSAFLSGLFHAVILLDRGIHPPEESSSAAPARLVHADVGSRGLSQSS